MKLKPMPAIKLMVGLTVALAVSARADLTHRYSFNDAGTTATDSIGGANGTVQGNATISDGTANFPGQSNGDYVDLPAGLITNYTTVTFEFWANVFDNGIWEEIFAFGNQTSGGEGANMLMFCPHTGSAPADFRMSYAQASPGYNDERVVNGVGILDNQGPTHVVCIFDPPHSTMSLYTNGALVGTLSPVASTGSKGFSLTNVVNAKSWLGRSLYNGDAPYNGTIDEFRIYNQPLGPLQVFVNSMAGPDTVVTNIVVESLTWNVNSNMVLGSRQDSSVTFKTATYGTVTLPGATEATYSSGDTSIVTVNASGQLFAMAVGSATVSATFNGTVNNVLVTVGSPKLVHRYSFASDASDSVGGANGTLVGAAKITAGAVVMPGDTTSADPAVSFVDLPNNLLAGLTAITIETWATDNGSANWARVWDLGNSVGGEGVSDTGSRYMFLSLPSGNANVQATIHINDRGGDNALAWANGGRPPVGKEAHIVYVSDVAQRKGWLYVDGSLVAQNDNMFVTPADIGASVNNWLGRSQYNDPAFNGSIDEFRIYNGPLTPLQVALDSASGPNNFITDPGTLQSVKMTVGDKPIYYGGYPVQSSLVADYQAVTNVNVSAVPGAAFQSSNPGVATIDNAGLVTATGLGQATLTGSFGGQSGTLTVTITTAPGFVPAKLEHRYSFGETVGSTVVKDSVGGADGAVMGNGAVFDGKGQLTLPGGGSSADDISVIAGYVDLPNGIISVLTNLSIETWVTWQTATVWQRIFDFGTSAGGEDISNGNGNYLFLSPQGSAALRFSVRDPETNAEPAPLTASNPLSLNEEVFLAISYDWADNVARLYSNAVLVASGSAPVNVSTISDVNNWLGRSQWGDPMFAGKFDEFRIYSGVLLPDQIATHYAAGPDSFTPPNKPTISISRDAKVTFTGKLQSADDVTGTWSDVTGATSPYTVPTGTTLKFYRAAQ